MESPRQIRLDDEEYIALKDEINQSVILESKEPISFTDLLASLPPNRQSWLVDYVGNGQFLIRAPASWQRDAISSGSVAFSSRRFTVNPDITPVSLQTDWPKVWIRLIKLPYEMRGVSTLKKIVQTFGTFLEADHNTLSNFDLRWARVYVSVHDPAAIPPIVPFDVITETGKNRPVHVRVMLDADCNEPILSLEIPNTGFSPTGKTHVDMLNPTLTYQPCLHPTMHIGRNHTFIQAPNAAGMPFANPSTNAHQLASILHMDAASTGLFNSPNVFQRAGSSDSYNNNNWLPTNGQFDSPDLYDQAERFQRSKRKLEFSDCSAKAHESTKLLPAQCETNPIKFHSATNDATGNPGNPGSGIVLYTHAMMSVSPDTGDAVQCDACTPKSSCIPRWIATAVQGVRLECRSMSSARKRRSQARYSLPPSNIDIVVLDDDVVGTSSSTHGSLD